MQRKMIMLLLIMLLLLRMMMDEIQDRVSALMIRI
jgi:hypothetical protein